VAVELISISSSGILEVETDPEGLRSIYRDQLRRIHSLNVYT